MISYLFERLPVRRRASPELVHLSFFSQPAAVSTSVVAK